jgi:hypothetical protein
VKTLINFADGLAGVLLGLFMFVIFPLFIAFIISPRAFFVLVGLYCLMVLLRLIEHGWRNI